MAEGEDGLSYLESNADVWFSFDGTQLLQRRQCRNAMHVFCLFTIDCGIVITKKRVVYF